MLETGCTGCMLGRRSFLLAAAAMLVAGKGLGCDDGATDGAIAPAAIPAAPGSVGDRIIDFHAHMVDPTVPPSGVPNLGVLPSWWVKFLPLPGPVRDAFVEPEIHIADMDRCGIQSQVITYATAIHGISWGDARRDLEVLRRINDHIAEHWVAPYAGRFLGSFALPTQDMKLSLGEMERAVTKLGARVLLLSSHTPDGTYYGDPRLHPLWEAAQHFGISVFIHPHGQQSAPPLDDFFLANSVGQGIEEAKVMSSIIYQGVFDKFPALKIIVAHAGGFLPHYYGRLDRNARNWPETRRNIKQLPSAYLKSFYYDSCVYAPEILAALIKVVGVERIVLGGDYPVGESDPLAALKATPGLAASDAMRIASDTPCRLLGAP